MEHSINFSQSLNEGIKHFLNDEYGSAIKIFTNILSHNSDNFQARLYRAIVYMNQKNFEESLSDLNEAEKSEHNPPTFELYFRKAVALFYLEKFVDSNGYFKKALKFQNSQEDRNKLSIWANKLEIELIQRDLLPSLEANVNLENIKFSHNWYQNATHVTLSLESNTAIDEKSFEFVFEKKNIKIIPKGNNQIIFEMSLSNSIVPEKSSYKVNNRRIELILKKEVEHFNWITVDRKKVEESSSAFNPSYPTSSKRKKDWDNVEKEINQELTSDAKSDPNEGMMKLFRDIYERSDENTRRAMIKSFQTSGGTVLSTNWSEVKEKDYEGKDRPEAPKGQEWRKD